MRRLLAQVVLSCLFLFPVLGCDKEYKKPDNAPEKITDKPADTTKRATLPNK